MNNFGRAVLAVGLSAVMTFTGPECFFQAGVEPVSVYAAEEKAVQSRTASEGRTSANDSEESESTTEVTTEKKEETTTATESKDSQTSSEKNTGSSDKESGQTGHTTESTEDTESTSTGHTKNNTGNNSGSDNGESSGTSTSGTSEEQTGNSTESTAHNKKKKNISSREDAEIEVKKTVKDIKDTLAEETSPDGSDKSNTFIPKIYNDTRLAMKNNKEYIAGYVYFNQTDSAWNQNGYCIAKAGCGPTSMAVVITSLTGRWVTPLDTAIWGYQHGFYSRAGSAHEMIPAMAAAYGLKCQGAGTDYNAIKKALKAGKPVVCLMGPGYFTRGGHFMVLVAIDKNDCVTIADVGSRARSAYKYRLSDVIAQSKGASAGGPFWIMSYDKESKDAYRKKQAIKDYTEEDFAEDFADVSYMKVKGDLPETLKEEKKDVSVKKVVSILTMSTGQSFLDSVGAGKGTAFAGTGSTGSGALSPVSQNSRVIVVSESSASQDSRAGSSNSDVASGSDSNGRVAESAAESQNIMETSQTSTTRKSQNLALTLKQDIAKRQWEKRLDLSWMDSYMEGTLEK